MADLVKRLVGAINKEALGLVEGGLKFIKFAGKDDRGIDFERYVL